MLIVMIELAITGALLVFLLARRGSLTLDVAILLTFGVIFGHAFFNVSAGPLPLTFPRLWTVWIFARWLWDYAQGRTTISRWGLTEIGLYGFLVYVAFQLTQTNWQFNEKKPLSYFLFFLLLPASVYFAVSNSPIDLKSMRLFRWAMVIFGGYLAFTAFCETRGPSVLVFPSYIMSPKFEEFLGRARGPFLNPVANGIAMTLAVAAAASFWNNAGRWNRPVIVGYSVALLAGVFLTYTRSVWIGAVIGIGGMVIWHMTPRTRVAFTCIALVIGVPAAIKVKELSSSFKRDKHVTVEQMEESASLRPLLAIVALEVFRDNPWFGVGYGQYMDHNRYYIAQAESSQPIQKVSVYVQHNSLFALAVETGLIGTTLFALFLLGASITAGRVAFNDSIPWETRSIAWMQFAVFGSMAFNSAWHDVLVIDGNVQLLLGLAAMTTAVQRQHGKGWSEATCQTKSISPKDLTPLRHGSLLPT